MNLLKRKTGRRPAPPLDVVISRLVLSARGRKHEAHVKHGGLTLAFFSAPWSLAHAGKRVERFQVSAMRHIEPAEIRLIVVMAKGTLDLSAEPMVKTEGNTRLVYWQWDVPTGLTKAR